MRRPCAWRRTCERSSSLWRTLRGLAALQTAVEAEAHRTAIAWAEIGQRIGEKLRPRALASLASSWHAQHRRLASRGDSYRLREKRRSGLLAKAEAAGKSRKAPEG